MLKLVLNPPNSTPTTRGILHGARDWKFDCDLPDWHTEGSKYVLPHKAILTSDIPDIFLISEVLKLIIFIELTCPMEENMELHRVMKSEKYQKLCTHLNPDWKSHVFTVEVGAKGFVNNKSFFCTFGNLGFSPRDSRKLLQDCSRAVIRCSYVIWVNRFNKNMIMSTMSNFSPPASLIFGCSSSTCSDSPEPRVDPVTPASP